MKVIQNGQKIEKTYEEICRDLGIIPEIKFVEVTNHGSISFTTGRPEEIRLLRSAAQSKKYSISRKLKEIRL